MMAFAAMPKHEAHYCASKAQLCVKLLSCRGDLHEHLNACQTTAMATVSSHAANPALRDSRKILISSPGSYGSGVDMNEVAVKVNTHSTGSDITTHDRQNLRIQIGDVDVGSHAFHV